MATGKSPLKRAKIDKIVQAVHSSLVGVLNETLEQTPLAVGRLSWT